MTVVSCGECSLRFVTLWCNTKWHGERLDRETSWVSVWRLV